MSECRVQREDGIVAGIRGFYQRSYILRHRLRMSRLRDRADQWLAGAVTRCQQPDIIQIYQRQRKNLGDWAIGRVVQDWVRTQGYSVVGTSINRKRWPVGRLGVIVGGGGILGSRLRGKIAATPAPVAILGVDVFGVDNTLSSNVRYASARSEAGVARLRDLGAETPAYAPDVVWAVPLVWPTVFEDSIESLESGARPRPTLGINVTAWPRKLHYRQVQRLSRGDETSEDWTVITEYTRAIRSIAELYLSRGWNVEAVPFAIDDELLARKLFDGTKVRVHRFSLDARKVLARLRTYNRFVATRYHSHVFALAAGTSVLSIAYGRKCEELWDYYRWPDEAQVGRKEILGGADAVVARWADCEGVRMPAAERLRMGHEAAASLQRAIAGLEGAEARAQC